MGTAKVKSGSKAGKVQYPYDAMVYIDGTTVIAVDSEGNTINRGTAGTDDTTVIQAAIDYVLVIGHGTVKIKSGTYGLNVGNVSFNPTIGITAYYCLTATGTLKICGEGSGKTILKLNDAQYDPTHNVVVMWIHDYTNFELCDLTIDGNKINQTGTYVDGAGLILTGGSRYGGNFHDLELKNSLGCSIYLGNNNGGYEKKAFVSQIYSHDNEWYVMFDNTENCIIKGIISENDAINPTAENMAVYIYGANNYLSRNDHSSFSGITVINGRICVRRVNKISLSDINVDASSITTSRGAIHIYEADSISISNVNLVKNTTDGYGVYVNTGTASVTGGYISSKTNIRCDTSGKIAVSNLYLVSSYSCFISFVSSQLIASNCFLVPTAGQYMYNVDAGSILKLDSIHTSIVAQTYASQGANFSCINSPPLGGEKTIRSHIDAILNVLGVTRLLATCVQCTGTTVNDYTRNANNFTSSVNLSTCYSFRGEATYYDFNGSSHYLYRTNDTDFDFGNSLTDSAFSLVVAINPDNVTSRQIIGKWDANSLREWRLFFDASGYPTLQLYDESVDKYIGRQDQTAFTTGSWKILVATYDGSGICAGCKIYIDGVQLDDADYTDAGYVAMEAINTNLMIGALKNAAAYSEYFDGKMTWIGIAAKELSPDEVWSLTQRLKGVLGI